MDKPNPTVKQKAVNSTIWSYIGFGAGRAITLISTAILARVLTPEQFGIVAYTTMVLTYSQIFNDLGFGAALIQRQDEDEVVYNTAFTYNLLFCLLIGVMVLLSANSIARYFSEPLVGPLLHALSLLFVLAPLMAIHGTRLRQQMKHKQKVLTHLVSDVGKGAVSIILALVGAGVWALVWGQVAGMICLMIATWVALPWMPRISFNRPIARELLTYGSSILGSNILIMLNDNVDYWIVGRLLGTVALGTYTLAYRLPELFIFNLLWILGGVLFPAYSLLKKEPEQLGQTFLKTMGYTQLLILPICIGLAFSAQPIISLLYGAQWGGAVPIVQWLAISFLLRATAYHTAVVYNVMGKPRTFLYVGLFNFVLTAVLLSVAARQGMLTMVKAHFVISIIQLCIRLWLARRAFSFSLLTMGRQFLPSLIGGVSLLLALSLIAPLIVSWHPFWRLLGLGGVGALSYGVALWLFARDMLLTLANLFGLGRWLNR